MDGTQVNYTQLEYETLFKLAYEENDREALIEVYRRREIRLAQLACKNPM